MNNNALLMHFKLLAALLSIWLLPIRSVHAQAVKLAAIPSPIIYRGDAKTAYRDPAVLYDKGTFYLYFTLSEVEADNRVYMYTAWSKSQDLVHWTAPRKITIKDQNLDFSSPGNVIRYQNEWVLCLQSYPRPNYTADQMPRYGTKDSRIFIMHSKDLEIWSKPELLRVKGPAVLEADMGRMIDPYLLEDKDEPGKYWCFYKQNGVSRSYSHDLKTWTFAGSAEAGENVCVLTQNNEYLIFNSPPNGISIKMSRDLKTWHDRGTLITLGQEKWDWAKGRLSAGTVLDLTQVPGIGRYILFFHGSGPLTEKEGDFDKNASLGIAWSTDLCTWDWPGR
ncbi:MAG: family 43 glycosylhydrolase [Janthinobacterium lividum]